MAGAMFQTYVSCHLWDLVDEGIDEVLGRLKGEAGADGVSVTVACPRVGLLRPHREASPRTFRSEGGLQFQPNKDAYSATRVRPVVAEWLRKTNPLAAVAEGCERQGLTLRGRIVCCHSGALASRHEFAAVKDVFGDLHPAWVCPSNPDVRECLRTLVADLSGSYPFAALELEAASFPPAESWRAGREICPDLGIAGEWLLGLCFCESCRQSAASDGIDAASAARSATVLLERALATGEPVQKSVEALIASDPILSAFAAWGERQVARLLDLLRQACRCRLVLRREGGRLTTGSDFAGLAAYCDALLTAPAEPADEIEPAVQAAAGDMGDVGKVEVGVSACAPACPDSTTLVRALSRAARSGVRTAVVENYGLLPVKRLDWIKQAARYAVRESE